MIDPLYKIIVFGNFDYYLSIPITMLTMKGTKMSLFRNQAQHKNAMLWPKKKKKITQFTTD